MPAQARRNLGEKTGGIRSILSLPTVYDRVTDLIGARRSRRILADRFIRALEGDRILDIGCGTAEILDYLPAVEYLGFDSNPAYIEAARARYGSRGRFVSGTVSDTDLGEYGTFDVVLAIGVLHHLTDDEARKLFDTARNALRPGGRLVTFDGCYKPGQNPLARFILRSDRGQNVRYEEAYMALAGQSFGEVTAFVTDDLVRIPYTHIIMTGTKTS
jgi:SAM-dependent methyltransferase